MSSSNGGNVQKKLDVRTLLRGVQAAEERTRLMGRLEKVYGVSSDIVTKCLALDKSKQLDPSQLSLDEQRAVFGGAELINSAEVQADLLEGHGINGNGSAPPRRHVRLEEGQIDLALFKSHDLSAIQAQAEFLEAVGNPPYRVTNPDGKVDFETDDLLELRSFLLGQGAKGIQIQRYKGLGEMNPEQLRDTTMHPEKRTVLQVNAEDEASADDMVVTLMGDLVEPRKKFIEKYALDVKNLDV